MATFPKFAAELKKHDAAGYHRRLGPIEMESAQKWLCATGWGAPSEYLEFLAAFGPGRYFDGLLLFFPLDRGVQESVKSYTTELERRGVDGLIAIGNAGTTEGCFCVSKQVCDQGLYWYSWETGSVERDAESFAVWIEDQPCQLFDEHSYTGFGEIRDMASVLEVIEERKAFTVRVVEYDMDLVRPPGKEEDALPRYNRVVFAVTKRRAVDLALLTTKILRDGSPYARRNVTYHALDVSELRAGQEARVDAYVFDLFNVPFAGIVVLYEPEIDLTSPMRLNYKEIRAFL